MSMGNYLCPRSVDESVMAVTETATVGMDHPTVVPANFDPEAESDQSGERPQSEH
jgi:hypothetical protein